MALTDSCDIFVAAHEDGFNRLIVHVMRQRPSLFNYATAPLAADPRLLCEEIDADPIVGKRGNPFVTIEDPLPILGSDYGLHFAAQLRDLQVDFHPGDEFTLPAELSPPLKAQRLAIKLRLCGGLGCPPDDTVDKLVPPPPNPDAPPREPGREPAPGPKVLRPLPFRALTCFCLEAFVTGGMRITEYWGKPWLEPYVDGVEIVDIEPERLENSIECYLKTLLRLVVLPKLRILLEHAPFHIMKLASVTLSPTPAPARVANNPAIEDDQVKAFIDVKVA
jgi:hypothetical protein